MRTIVMIVACLASACGGSTDEDTEAAEQARAEAAIESAIARRDWDALRNYAYVSPDGAHIAQVRTVLGEMAAETIPRYRLEAARTGGDPAIVLAMTEVLQAAAASDRTVPRAGEATAPPLPPAADPSSPDGALRAMLELDDPFAHFGQAEALPALGQITRVRFLFQEAPSIAEGQRGLSIVTSLAISPDHRVALDDGTSFRSIQATTTVRVHVPAEGGRPGRVVERTFQRLPEDMRVDYSQLRGPNHDATNAATRNRAVYVQMLRHLGYAIHGQQAHFLGAHTNAPRSRPWESTVAPEHRAFDAVVTAADGAPVEVGAACMFQIGRGEEAQPCRYALVCAGHVLYGAGATGYNGCPAAGAPYVDANVTAADGDPALTVRFAERELVWRDSAEGETPARTLTARLSPLE